MGNERFIAGFDGTELFLKVSAVDNARALVIVVHGLCEHQGRYDYVAERLNEAGFTVYLFDHRGHGRSKGKSVYFNDFNEIVDDLHVVVTAAASENPGVPLFVLGHSMGGYAAALFGTKYPGLVKGILLSGALTRYSMQSFGPLPMQGDPDSYLPNSLEAAICSDSAVVEAYVNDPYVKKEISVALCNSIGCGVDWLKENAGQFQYPVLVMHGANDSLVSEQDSRDFFGEIASKDKGLLIFPGLLHEILNEPSRDDVLNHVIKWIGLRL